MRDLGFVIMSYHGHNFRLIVKITGEINPETGFVMDLKVLGNIIREENEAHFDHKNLTLIVQNLKKNYSFYRK
ncbi:6-pyruvoyltetrahydropterin/6-carboxytetrahydropterin synthase [Flavobacterium succinicans]|uniref:6-carboxy-5,6,7,8-tetrahydropterin synthase n=1 Tax=Flavobacterium succinicans TaxID=29536 RepID=A0A1I4RGI5_9FLAO|nr:6-carboxytetrahydropterin synthase [Flavobacterium succinicans]SFM51374.1 6-pyruvoyltetrahydropterin/6-carboxytetrahydropterin synthase [Flavobacterium succinicans]